MKLEASNNWSNFGDTASENERINTNSNDRPGGSLQLISNYNCVAKKKKNILGKHTTGIKTLAFQISTCFFPVNATRLENILPPLLLLQKMTTAVLLLLVRLLPP